MSKLVHQVFKIWYYQNPTKNVEFRTFLATEKHGKNPRSHNTEVGDCVASGINAEGLKNDL